MSVWSYINKKLPSQSGQAGKFLKTDGTSVSWAVPTASVDLKPYVVIDNTGNQAITATEATVVLQTESVSNAGYTLASNEITVNQDGTYLIMYSLNYNITDTAGGTRGRVTCHIQDDNSGSFAVTAGSYASVYHREAAGGSGLSGQTIRALTNGDKIRLRVDRTYGSTNVDTIANQVSVSIIKVG